MTRLRDKGVDAPIEVVFRSFQLDPSAPVGQPVPVIEGYAKKFGGTERAQQILDHVTRVAAEDEIEFRMDVALRANTILAHRALHWVLETRGAEDQGIFKERLLSAYFTEGLDVGALDTVLACARECGLESDALATWLAEGHGVEEVMNDLEGAAAREISAVPSFVIDDRFLVPGAQDVDVFVQVLERVLAK